MKSVGSFAKRSLPGRARESVRWGKVPGRLPRDAGRIPRKCDPRFQGELDWVVMKALEKDRSRRYETALDFSLDVQRFLNEEAVLACPPSTVYRVRKFIRRHRASVVVGLALTFLLFAGIAGTITGWIAETKKASQLARQVYLMHLTNADSALLTNDYLRAREELDACLVEKRDRIWQFQNERIDAKVSALLDVAERPWFIRDGKQIIGIGKLGSEEQKMARIWDLPSGRFVAGADMEHASNLAILSVSQDESFVVGGGVDGSLVVWGSGDGTEALGLSSECRPSTVRRIGDQL